MEVSRDIKPGITSMQISEKTKKALSAGAWYHGTTYESYLKLKEGIVVDWNKGHDLDFGYGFYLTTSERLAESYISRLLSWKDDYTGDSIPLGKQPVIIEYSALPIEWFTSPLYKTKAFPSFDDEFAEFVFFNRTENVYGESQHPYDAIFGVMSDSQPTKLIVSYNVGDITKEDVIAALKKGNSMKQLSLHNQKLCDMLYMQRAYLFNLKTYERKELDIHE